jgi:hypothetical protein
MISDRNLTQRLGITAVLLLAAFLCSCTSVMGVSEATKRAQKQEDDAAIARSSAAEPNAAAVPNITKMKTAWLGSSLLAPAPFRPKIYDKPITELKIPVSTPVMDAITLLSVAANYPIGIADEVRTDPKLTAPSEVVGTSTDQRMLVLTGKFEDVAKRLAAHYGLTIECSEDESVRFTKYITAMFRFPAVPGTTEMHANTAKATNAQTGSNSSTSNTSGSFSGDSSLKFDAIQNSWAMLETELKTQATAGIKLTLNPNTGLILVRALPEDVDRLGKIIESEKKRVNRVVTYKVEVRSVGNNHGSQYGISADAIYQRLGSAMRLQTLANSIVDQTQVSGIQETILAPLNGGYNSLAGSTLFVNALNEQEKTASMYEDYLSTQTGIPTTTTRTSQVVYLASTTPAPAGGIGVSSGTVGLVPGQVTTGFVMQVLPIVQDDGSVNTRISLDVSQLEKIATLSSGQPGASQTIQGPIVTQSQVQRSIPMRVGTTLLLTGFTMSSSQYTNRDLFGNIGGPSAVSSISTDAVVVLLTLVKVEGV